MRLPFPLWIFFLALFCLTLPGTGLTKEDLSYQDAKLVTWSVQNVPRTRYTGEPFGNVTFGTQVSYLAPLYHMTVDLEGKRYELNYAVKSSGSYVPKLAEGDPLKVRFVEDGRAMQIQMPDKKTFKAEIPAPISPDLEKMIQALKDPAKSSEEKWNLCRDIQKQGKAAIPPLVHCVSDTTPIGKAPVTGGECFNLPANLPTPPQCKDMQRTETLGERCELMLYNILTPNYTSAYMTPVTTKAAPPRPFVISDWKKWWEKYQGMSLDELHAAAKKKIDDFWLHNHKQSVEWE